VNGYGAIAWMLQTTLPTAVILQPVFSFSGPLKKHLAGKGFAEYGDVKQAVTSWLQMLNTNF
jgi:hypothetical protein